MPLLARRAAETPDKTCAFFPESNESLTFRELDDAANRIANGLVSLGLQAGEGIALLLPNVPEFLPLLYGAKRAGLMVTPLSIHLRPHEVAHVLRDSGAKLLVADGSLGALVAGLDLGAAAHRYATGGGIPGFAPLAWLSSGQPATWPDPPRPIGRDFLYSSGTTGLPKGIRRPLIAWEDRDKPEFDMSWKRLYGFGEDTVYLSPAPLYHAAPLR